MDIAALSVLMNQAQVKQQASLSVMKMMMDSTEVQASDMLKMLDGAVEMPEAAHPYLGGSIDLKA